MPSPLEIKSTFQTFHDFSGGEPIVSMIIYHDVVLVATGSHVYEIRDGKLGRLVFEVQEVVGK